jgi:colicin import membrane protein
MKKASLIAELKKRPWILFLVVAVHITLAVVLSINLSDTDKPPMPAATKHNIIDAVAIDAKAYDEREKQKALAKQREIDKKREQEKLAKQKLAEEKKRQQELAKQKELKKKQELEKKKAEQQRIEKEKQLAIAKKQAEEKKKREEQARLEKQRQEKERLEKERLEKERQAKLEAERKRKEEERRRAEEKAEFERALLEEERREEEARKAAARAAKLQTMRQQYILMIAQKVENNWLRPVTNIEGQSCDVIVTQTMSGDVIDVVLKDCSNDVAFQRSVERAVRKASPLPLPPDPELFERQIYFKFKPRS